jgi:hypothetical protein
MVLVDIGAVPLRHEDIYSMFQPSITLPSTRRGDIALITGDDQELGIPYIIDLICV